MICDQYDFLNAIITVKPGSYLRIDSNFMVKIQENRIGIVIGERIKNDNSCAVAVENEILLISKETVENNIISFANDSKSESK
jgi:hypothetical protein